ncbi:lamin tail domain-containing protein [Subtercola endophyticus]|uniref:lamin tail domain-containing protein n=1 Tax=Subtercola endophyticus TaxID=2895559 RepID=UPI001E5E5148|nr:lamin tail domain-containing protein [Subtercola endophyticus]UFS58406.1 lamin tail domain-containing protein [Subtercola endophyticus]
MKAHIVYRSPKGRNHMTHTWRPKTAVLASLALAVPLLAALSPVAATSATAATPLPSLVVNEVDASGVPQDWIELKNVGAAPVDASGLVLKDNKNDDRYEIAAGTIIPAGGYASFDVADSFGLGKGGDAARLYLNDGTTLVDGFTWASDAAPATWGRCPDGTGAFAVTKTGTKGAANDCATTTPPPTDPTTPTVPDALQWPGSADVSTANVQNFFGSNMSGLSYELGANGSPDTLWAVQNGGGDGDVSKLPGGPTTSAMYRLQKSGDNWVPATDNGWGLGKTLHYTDGTGNVDAEGVVHTDAGTFVSSERDNANNKISRPAVLRYDTSAAGTSLTAAVEWNLVSDLPTVGANLGLEGIAYVPDSYLTSKGFVDEKTGAVYNPATYANHGDGLYFVGLEGTGSIYAYALDQTDGSKFTRVATIESGFPSIMEVQYDPEKAAIWAVCDNTCGGQFAVLDVAQTGSDAGHFAVTTVYNRPAGLGDFNNEGFVTAPQALCVNGVKPVIWADDDQDDGYSLREGTIDCVVAVVTDPTDPTTTPTAPAGAGSTGSGSTGAATGTTGAAHLANTGAQPVVPAAVALFVLLAGAGALIVRRRRARA